MFFYLNSQNKNPLPPLCFQVAYFDNENSNFKSQYNLNVISPDDYYIKSLNSKVIETKFKIMLPKDSYLHIKRSNCCKKQVFNNNGDLTERNNHFKIKEEIIKAGAHKHYTQYDLNITVYNVNHEQDILIKKNQKICEVIFQRGAKNDREYYKLLQLEEKLENKFLDFIILSKNLLYLKSQRIKESQYINEREKENLKIRNRIKKYMDWREYEKKKQKKEKIKEKLKKHRQKYLICKNKINICEKVQPLNFFDAS